MTPQLLKLIAENSALKHKLEDYRQAYGKVPYIDDKYLKGGYHVVKTITDRDNIQCCYRKQGMKVLVVGNDLSFKEYILKTNDCKENIWEEVDVIVEENEVFLIEDYSELSENLTTQKELNLILKQLVLNLQTDLDDKLEKGTYTGTAQDLKNDIDNKANISHTHDISSITNLQTILDDKQDKLSSYDESILIENDGNIEGNVSLFEEYFEQQECELNFTPIQIVAVYQDGIKLLNSEYEIILPKKIKIKEYVDENIQIEYTHLKS